MISLKKITLTLGTLGLLTLGASSFSSANVAGTTAPVTSRSIVADLAVPTAHANPDYICVKSTASSPCSINWAAFESLPNKGWANQSRTGYGTRVTSVVYYSVRIWCVESGDVAGWVVGNNNGASGRRTGDYVNSTESCSVTETDTTPPSGIGQVQ